jgi:uncharacterized RDD family membrane protein YckC
MRCPKCGYNSFDHLDNCKKCGKELLEYKQRFGIKSVLFPGQMKPIMSSEENYESASEDVVVAAAAVTVAGSAAFGATSATVGTEASASDADDFGFDFMGESEDEEDLSFDELFEEAPVDEDVEETLPGPAPAAEDEDATEFSFDSAVEEDEATERFPIETELDSDFGFDLDDLDNLESGTSRAEGLASDDIALPLESDEGFDFNSEEIAPEEMLEEVETGGDPKDPFDLPESSQHEEAPEQTRYFFTDQPLPTAGEELVAKVAAEADAVEEPAEEPAEEPVIESAVVGIASAAADISLDVTPVVVDGGSDGLEPEVTAERVEADSATAAAIVEFAESAALPTAVLDDTPQDTELLPPVTSRVAAFFCDLLLLSTVAVSFIVAAEIAMSGSSDRLLPSFATLIDLSIPYFLVLFCLAFGYFTLFHFFVGQTPGKMLAGLRVETLEGEPLVLSQAFLRSVGGLLQLLPVGLGYLAALSSPGRRGWNDRLAGTRLVALKGGLKA